ncbi:MAG TPA: hypothetical protein VK806_08330 [Bacteroidia bacterium]|jgi:hypothetical protein|nr:hypothetical protein [Bacteroidia bacterium]
MKKSTLLIAILCFIGFASFAQTDSPIVLTGTITDVRAYNDQYAMNVGNTMVVLITHRVPGKTMNVNKKYVVSFDINEEYKDLLIENKDTYVLNPKYAGKTFKVTYSVNGKGWKYIKSIELSK